jgi:arsenite-transporting ATPase
MGKGGVGKTTLAAAIAVELASLGHQVELTTTDPAAHLASVMGAEAGGPGALRVSRIDPERETADYIAEVLAGAGAGLGAEALAVLEEDLRSPCTAEIAVFRAFARTVALAADRFVVLDTAPTGHTLLMLDTTRAYHREVGRQGGAAPPEVEALLDRLGDPTFTSAFIVTLPEATPVHEAASLQDDLRRAGIEPAAWVVNQSLAATSVTDPELVAKAAAEARYIDEVERHHASRVAVVPLLADEPRGAGGVANLIGARART